MRNKDAFSSCHPLVNFLYFALVLVFAMFFTYPASQIISLLSALVYAAQLNGRRATGKSLLWLLPMMFTAVLVWFQCYTAVMTSGKFIYLFGRVIPALSLVLSMTLRFMPKFKHQLQVITEAQRCLGRDVSEGTVWQRIKTAVTILSILVTWALENAIETADSMKGRGYGLPGRTAFSIYCLDSRDKTLLMWLGFCGFFIVSDGWQEASTGGTILP